MNKAVFKRIKQRPGLYIGHASIRNFYSFLGGYYFARMDLEITHTKQDREFSGFQEWIQDKYNTTTRHLWADIVLLNFEKMIRLRSGNFLIYWMSMWSLFVAKVNLYSEIAPS